MKINFPEKAYIGNTVYKKLFIENSDLNAADKKLFNEKIEKITWEYSLKPENCFIKSYKDEIREYPEVELIVVKVKDVAKAQHLVEIIMRKIPYPMVLILQNGDKYQLWTAQQRTNQADISKNVLEDFIETDWISENEVISLLNHEVFDKTNLYRFYSSIIDRISIFRLKSDKENLTGEAAREEYNRIKAIDAKIATLRNELKMESQFNRKMEINIRIKQLENERNS